MYEMTVYNLVDLFVRLGGIGRFFHIGGLFIVHFVALHAYKASLIEEIFVRHSGKTTKDHVEKKILYTQSKVSDKDKVKMAHLDTDNRIRTPVLVFDSDNNVEQNGRTKKLSNSMKTDQSKKPSILGLDQSISKKKMNSTGFFSNPSSQRSES